MEEEQQNKIEIENNIAIDRKKFILQTLFLIALFIAIGALIFATITIIRNVDALKNPVGYNLAKYKIPYCSYMDDSGNVQTIFALNKTS
jgi:hypothetical protein